MEDLKKLLPGYFYHIYNRGNNKEDIFIEPENYTYSFCNGANIFTPWPKRLRTHC
jgi:hypothetical protein